MRKTKKTSIRAEIQTKQMTISAPLTADINISRDTKVGFERSPMPKMRFARAAPANQNRSAPTGSRGTAIDYRRNFFLFLIFSCSPAQHCRNILLVFSTHLGARMKLSNQSEVPVYTISGSNTARPLPEWLARRRKRSLKNDPEYANRIELLQDFEFEEASQCIRASEDGEWVMSTG